MVPVVQVAEGMSEGNSPVPEEQTVGRLFLAVPIAAPVRRELADALRSALGRERIPGRRVPAENWHLTLRFLGDTSAAAYQRVGDALDHAPLGERFPLRLGGLGAFPRPARAAVLWLGIEEGGEALAALAATTEEAVRSAGFAPERRPFAAHLTLSRIRPPRDVRALLEGARPFSVPLSADRVVLFRSVLGSGPVRYQALREWALG